MDDVKSQSNPVDFKNQTDNEVLEGLKSAIKEERRATLQVLFYLREVERRMIYAKHGYPSLYEFVVKFLGYSGGAAYRRISVMRLMREMPELSTKVESGVVTLSGVAQVQSFFINEMRDKSLKYSNDEKREILYKIENKSTREIEKTLLEIAPERIPHDRVRQLTPELSEIKIIVSGILRSKLDHLRDLLSHHGPGLPYGEIIHKASDIAIERLDPQLRQFQKRITSAPRPYRVTNDFNTLEMQKENPDTYRAWQKMKIPATLRRAVWSRDKGRCVFVADETNKVCGARHLLEIDHIMPVGKGGTTELTNLRLVCRAHNLLYATQEYGEAHMQKYVSWVGGVNEEKLTQKRD